MCSRIVKKSILNKEGIVVNIPCERRAYESVDDRRPILGYIS